MAPGAHFLGQAATDSLGIVYFPMTATNKARSHTVVASSEIHLELMDSYRRISSYSTNVGRAIMSRDKFGDPDYEED